MTDTAPVSDAPSTVSALAFGLHNTLYGPGAKNYMVLFEDAEFGIPAGAGAPPQGHYLVLRRYRNTGVGAVGFVASVNLAAHGGDWAVYLGAGSQNYTGLTRAVAAHGAKCDEDLACLVFPQLPVEMLRA